MAETKHEYLLDGNKSLEAQESALLETEKQGYVLERLYVDEKEEGKNHAVFEEAPLGRLADLHLMETGVEKPEEAIKGKCDGGKKATLVLGSTILVEGRRTNIAAYRCV